MNRNQNDDINDKMMKFLKGRYGPDELGRVLMILGLIFLVVSLISRWYILCIPGILLQIYAYYRIFSKKLSKRYAENQKYMSIFNPVYEFFYKVKRHIVAILKTVRDKNYKYFVCPGCKQYVRIPKGKGKIKITCTYCKTQFISKS